MRTRNADGRSGGGHRRWWGMVTLAAVPLLAACGGGAGSATSTSAATTATTGSPGSSSTTQASTAASASRGCGLPASPGTLTLSPTIAGKSRVAILHIPSGYHPTTPVPLVVNMHGSQSTALEQEAFSGMDATADADTFMVVYPQGDIPAGAGFEWNVPGQPLFGGAPVPADAPNDVSFIQQLVSMLEQKYCIDQNRVYATGFSGGARMASQLACDASSMFAAVAPVSGLRLPSPCPATRPVPVMTFHGTADPVDPYDGNGQKYWTYSVPVAAQRWASQNGCSATPVVSRPDPTVTLTSYGDCQGGSAVELYTIAGEGHEWPGGPHLAKSVTRVLGAQSTAISANSTMWEFFVSHPLT
jgi:polyhydroxybutyrate depolymerase